MGRRLVRLLPPGALFLGLFLFGVSLLVLGTQATEESAVQLQPGSLTVANGSAVLVYPIAYYGYSNAFVEVSYAFPQAVGDAYFVGCPDLRALASGAEPTAPALAFTRLREGSFIISSQTVGDPDVLLFDRAEEGRRLRCEPGIAFRWAAPEADPSLNRPTADIVYHPPRLDGETFALLAFLMAGSALLALFGGLAWARGRPRQEAPSSEDSTVEALRGSLDRMGEQLERTRRHLLYAGVLGVFLWYPFLVPWAWQQAARSSDAPLIPWAVAALTLMFLLVLTLLWAREFVQLDRELQAWRGRLGALRDRENDLMDTLEHQDG